MNIQLLLIAIVMICGLFLLYKYSTNNKKNVKKEEEDDDEYDENYDYQDDMSEPKYDLTELQQQQQQQQQQNRGPINNEEYDDNKIEPDPYSIVYRKKSEQ